MSLSSSNKLDFVPLAAESHFLPSFDWRTIGAVFAIKRKDGKEGALAAAKVSGRGTLVLKDGYDPVDGSTTGRVIDGSGDLGVTLRNGSVAISLTAGNLTYRAGLDNPLAAAQTSVGDASVPSLKFTLAKEYSDDSYAAVSWDIAQRKPELALGWAGSTFTQQAALVLHADPLLRTYKMSASVSFPGPEWRDTYLDETNKILEEPEDDGARHRLWATHTVKDRQWSYRTRVGGAFDLGRLLNYAANFVDTQIQPRIPNILWRIPLSGAVYDIIIPQEDDKQVRYRIKGVDAEVSHDFGLPGVQLGLAKHFKHATLRGAWHTGTEEAALTYRRSGVSLTARIARQEGGSGGWGKPALLLSVEPLGLL